MSQCRMPIAVVCLVLSAGVLPADDELKPKPDIRQFSQHFIDAETTAPWSFGPASNIAEVSTTEHRGLVTIREAGKGQDIKGLLAKPISLSDYPPPWEFHLGIMQNHLALKGLSEKQINYAIGLNLGLTFFEPDSWPKDRTKAPDDLRSVQLFVSHLGNQGENYRPGVPLLRRSALNMGDHSPEAYFFFGRGNLSEKLNGNWNFGYSWVGPDPTDAGTWSKRGGPAATMIRFRVSITDDYNVHIGIGYGDHPGWRMRTINTAKFGRIKGVWEIGPVISLDRWIPDTLPKLLKIDEVPPWLTSFPKRQKVLGKDESIKPAQEELEKLFKVDPPDPRFAYYIDYATFYANGPGDVEHLSEEFNIPGFLADQKYYVEGNGICETHSNPGYMTATLFGHNSSWAMCPILRAGGVDLTNRKPPFEIETSFIGPGDDAAWNLWWNVGVYDKDEKFNPWQPGLKFIPGKGMTYFDVFNVEPDHVPVNEKYNLRFEKPLSDVLSPSEPIQMRIQIPDSTHMRVGFRRTKKDAWTWSSTFDASDSLGRITKFAYPCLVAFQGRGVGGKGYGAGNYPNFQKFKVDYIRFRYALTD